MSDEPRDLTDEESRWLKRMQRVLDAQPATLTIYCHGDSASVLDSHKYEASYDGRVPRVSDLGVPGLRTRNWIAGDW